MRVIGIIAEFNPFHKGHEYLISKAKSLTGDSRAIAMPIISGHFTQRGLPSLLPPQVRARQAMNCGADLVLQLPFTFSCAPSSRFADGGVSALISTGVLTDIAFGVDTGRTDVLKELAESDFESSDTYSEVLKQSLSDGLSFPAARAEAICEATGKDVREVISGPNSILALDYLKALRRIDKQHRINVMMIPREGEGYSSLEVPAEDFASASAIRHKLIAECAPEYRQSAVASSLIGLMPDASLAVMLSRHSEGEFDFIDFGKYLRTALFHVNMAAGEALDRCAYMGDSLSRYLGNAAADIRPGVFSSDDYDGSGFEKYISTRHYTLTRIERALASCAIGQTEDDLQMTRPLYNRVLGFNREGRYCLKIMRKCTRVPIIMNPSDALELYSSDPALKRMHELDMRAAAFYWELTGKDPAHEWELSPVQV